MRLRLPKVCVSLLAALCVMTHVIALVSAETGEYLIPNIVHQTYDYKKPRHFFYMSLLSVQHFQKPDRHILWINAEGHHRANWEHWLEEASQPRAQAWEHEFADFIKNGTIEAKLVVYPVHPPNMNDTYVTDKVHRSDFLRMNVLRDMGGIYIDGDVLILKPMDELRRFHFVTTGDNVVNPNKKAANARRLNTGIILCEPHAKFLKVWESNYQYDPAKYSWEHHASVIPYELMLEYPDLIHVETNRLSPVSYGLSTSEAAAALTCGLLLPSKKAIWYPTALPGQAHAFHDKPDSYLYATLQSKIMIHLTMSHVPKISMLRQWLGGPQDFAFMPSWLGRIFRLSTYKGQDDYDYAKNERLLESGDTQTALKMWEECRGQLGMNTPVLRSAWGAAHERQQLVARHLP